MDSFITHLDRQHMERTPIRKWTYNSLSRILTDGKLTFYNVIAQDTELTIFNNQWFVESVLDFRGGVEGYRLISVGRSAFFRCKNINTIILPGVKTIWDGAFEHCTFLTTAFLPDVATIGDDAFLGCSSLNRITLPNTTIVGNNSFQDCTSLQSITLLNVVTIGENAFKCCTALTQISLPLILNIVDLAFADCKSLKAITILHEPPTLGADVFMGVSVKDITLTIPKNSVGYDSEPWSNMQQVKIEVPLQ